MTDFQIWWTLRSERRRFFRLLRRLKRQQARAALSLSSSHKAAAEVAIESLRTQIGHICDSMLDVVRDVSWDDAADRPATIWGRWGQAHVEAVMPTDGWEEHIGEW